MKTFLFSHFSEILSNRQYLITLRFLETTFSVYFLNLSIFIFGFCIFFPVQMGKWWNNPKLKISLAFCLCRCHLLRACNIHYVISVDVIIDYTRCYWLTRPMLNDASSDFYFTYMLITHCIQAESMWMRHMRARIIDTELTKWKKRKKARRIWCEWK